MSQNSLLNCKLQVPSYQSVPRLVLETQLVVLRPGFYRREYGLVTALPTFAGYAYTCFFILCFFQKVRLPDMRILVFLFCVFFRKLADGVDIAAENSNSVIRFTAMDVESLNVFRTARHKK